MRIVPFITACLGCSIWISGLAWAQTPALYGAEHLDADIDGDGMWERIALTPYMAQSGDTCYQINVFDEKGKLLWNSAKEGPEAEYTAGAVSCLLADVDGDDPVELVFGGDGKLSRGRKGANSIFAWKDGKFIHSKDVWLVRSPKDTTEYIVSTNPEADGETLRDRQGNPVKVTLGNLRCVNRELWADVLLNGDLVGTDVPEQYYAPVRIAFINDCFKALEAKNGERTIAGEKYAWFAGSDGVEDRIIAVPRSLDLELITDLNCDGNPDTVRFNEYYPGTYHFPRYQFVVTDIKKCLWMSPRQLAQGDKEIEGAMALGGVEKLGRGQGGLSINPGTSQYPFSFLSDIDGDGKVELVANGCNRCGSRYEVWRWEDGEFRFVRIGKLLQSDSDDSVFKWVDDPRPAGNYNNLEYVTDDMLRQNRIAFQRRGEGRDCNCLNELHMETNELWGSLGDEGGRCLEEVRLQVVPGGLQIVEKR